VKDEDFDRLKCGDLVRIESTGEVLMVNQVRFPGFYVAGRCNPKTCERLDLAMHLLTRNSDDFTLLPRDGRK
jgi:hypothetical protein